MDNKHIEHSLLDSATEVFEKMLFLEIKLDSANESHPVQEGISGEISFEGVLNGKMRLDCSISLAKELTIAFLGIGEDELDNSRIDDNMKELVNMICGNMFCRLDEEKSIAKLGIPAVVRKSVIHDNPLTHKPIVSLIFSCSAVCDSEGKDERFGLFLFEQIDGVIN